MPCGKPHEGWSRVFCTTPHPPLRGTFSPSRWGEGRKRARFFPSPHAWGEGGRRPDEGWSRVFWTPPRCLLDVRADGVDLGRFDRRRCLDTSQEGGDDLRGLAHHFIFHLEPGADEL